MSAPPVLPCWIRNTRVDGYRVAHEICPDETRLYGTEDLYGNWNGRVLLLAKDWGPSCILGRRLMCGDPRPYYHGPKMKANRPFVAFAGPHAHLGLRYESALANLLRDDGRTRGTLPKRDAAIEYGIRATRFTVDHMPNLRWIVCMGNEAWECATGALGLQGDWRPHRDSGTPLDRLIAAFHPSARISRERAQVARDLMARLAEQDVAA
jgi:hypothetical protein